MKTFLAALVLCCSSPAFATASHCSAIPCKDNGGTCAVAPYSADCACRDLGAFPHGSAPDGTCCGHDNSGGVQIFGTSTCDLSTTQDKCCSGFMDAGHCCCSKAQQVCTNDGDCCGAPALKCNTTTNLCFDCTPGQTCSTNADCCAGTKCDAGLSGACCMLDTLSDKGSPIDCCSAHSDGGVCCELNVHQVGSGNCDTGFNPTCCANGQCSRIAADGGNFCCIHTGDPQICYASSDCCSLNCFNLHCIP